MSSTDQTVMALLRRHLVIRDSLVSATDRLSEDLGLDSLQRVELVLDLEEALDVALPDGLEDARTVGDLIQMVKQHVR